MYEVENSVVHDQVEDIRMAFPEVIKQQPVEYSDIEKTFPEGIDSVDAYQERNEFTPQQAEIVKGLMPTKISDVPNNLSDSIKKMPFLNINEIGNNMTEPDDMHVDLWNIPEDEESNRLKSFALANLLAFQEARKGQLPSEELGRKFDSMLVSLREILPNIKVDNNVVAAVSEEMWQAMQEDYPGLNSAIRDDLLRQTVQMLSNNSTKIKTHLDIEKGVTYESTSDKILQVSPEKKEELLLSMDTSSQTDAFCQIMSLSSPFTYSLGNSPQGKNNLEEFDKTLDVLSEKISLLSEGSKLKEIAEWAILSEQYQIKNGKLEDDTLSHYSAITKKRFNEYAAYRADHPLWEDKLEIYKSVYKDSVKPDLPSEFTEKLRPGLTTDSDSLLSILSSDDYLSFHETYKTHGSKQKYHRSRIENIQQLLSEGTPTDPYVLYANLKVKDPDQLDYSQSWVYGRYTVLTKPEVLDRTSGVDGDSFLSRELPRAYQELLTLIPPTFPKDGPYYGVELEIHGGLKTNEIEAVYISIDPITENDSEKEKRKEIERICKEKNIEIIYKPTTPKDMPRSDNE